MSTFGTYHLAERPTEFQPVRKNNFRFILTGVDALLQAGIASGAESLDNFNPNTSDLIYGAQDVIDFSVLSFEAPHFSQTPIEVKRGNSTLLCGCSIIWSKDIDN